MPSPFPGMDPYLEASVLWPDFHLTVILAMRAELNARLPARYKAAADRQVWMDGTAGTQASAAGDAGPVAKDGEGPLAVSLPAVCREGTRYLKVLNVQNRRMVTLIEVLGPAHKEPGDYREAYLKKRIEYPEAGISLVEIDLLRGGQRLPLGTPAPPADYYVLVCRAAEMPRASLWPISVRDPLPVIPVPLDGGENDVPLSLRACLDRAYDEARYDREVNYAAPADPPLREADAAWARKLLASRPVDIVW